MDSVVQRVDGLMSTAMDREMVLLNPARDNYIAMDETGQRIWTMLEEPMRVRDLCDLVEREFAGDRPQIAADVVEFLEELNAESLVHVAQG